MSEQLAETILTNGKIALMDAGSSFAEAIAIRDGHVLATGTQAELQQHVGPATQMIDLGGRTAIPGLNDSHLHLIRGGLSFNMELRWDGVPSLADALRMLKEQAQRTPAPQWVRVVGGWNEWQFAERRMPTLAEINAAAPDTPVFVLHLYDRALLNGAAMRACGYTRDNLPKFPACEVQCDRNGEPTGMLIAKPNALVLYVTLAKGPLLGYEDQRNSSRQFMRELNRLGITSVVDAGGGYCSFPDDYKVMQDLHRDGEMTVRIAYNLFTQRAQHEIDDFQSWVKTTEYRSGDNLLRHNGAGEMLTFSAADFEDFLQPRSDLPGSLEQELEAVVRTVVGARWPFRLHATYDESITRFLNVFERVNRDIPFEGLHWFFDHAETVSDHNLARIATLGGGIAIQDRMAFQGEYFVDRYGAEAAKRTPPIKRMLSMGIPVGAGTDATRVSSFNPFVSLYWLITGKTVGGLALYDESATFDRYSSLRLYTEGSAWFSNDQNEKGTLLPGQLADVAVLSDDFFSVAEEEIKGLTSVLTILEGKVVYAARELTPLGPPELPVSPSWSPVAAYGGYHSPAVAAQSRRPAQAASVQREKLALRARLEHALGLGCDCWAF